MRTHLFGAMFVLLAPLVCHADSEFKIIGQGSEEIQPGDDSRHDEKAKVIALDRARADAIAICAKAGGKSKTGALYEAFWPGVRITYSKKITHSVDSIDKKMVKVLRVRLATYETICTTDPTENHLKTEESKSPKTVAAPSVPSQETFPKGKVFECPGLVGLGIVDEDGCCVYPDKTVCPSGNAVR